MFKKSHTPPCPRGSKSPISKDFRAHSKQILVTFKPESFRKSAASASRSASRLNHNSERAEKTESRNERRPTKDFAKEYASTGRKKGSVTGKDIALLVAQNQNISQDNKKLTLENEKLRGQNQYLCSGLERIKRECVRLIYIEGFKIKKLEETLQEKELMLQFLRSSSSPRPGKTPAFKSSKPPSLNCNNLSLLSLEEISAIEIVERNNFMLSSIRGENRGTIESEDSLAFSKDKEKSNVYLQSGDVCYVDENEDALHPRLAPLEVGCPTFDVKELDAEKVQHFAAEERQKRKTLKIEVDTKSLLNLCPSPEDDLITHSTKKRINLTMKEVNTDQNENLNVMNIGNLDKKKRRQKQNVGNIERVEVNLPHKERKTASKNCKVSK